MKKTLEEKKEEYLKIKNQTPEVYFTKEVLDFVGECLMFGRKDLAEDLLTLEHISLKYIEKDLLNDMKTANVFGQNAAVLIKLNKKEEAEDLLEKAKFYVTSQQTLNVLAKKDTFGKSQEFQIFAMNFAYTEFENKPKPGLRIV